MRHERNFRVIKRGLTAAEATQARADNDATATRADGDAHATRAETEREMRRVVSTWVSEHRRVADELRRTLASALMLRA